MDEMNWNEKELEIVTVNVHDAAYNLEKAIRNSNEYSHLQKMYQEVFEDDKARKVFENFRNIQLEFQQKQMRGEDITEQEVLKAQETVALAQQDEKISKLMEAEQRMSIVINELNQIIMKPIEDLYRIQ